MNVMRNERFSLYKICGEGVERFVISTPETRMVCNEPLLAGFDYVSALRKGLARALSRMPDALPFRHLKDTSVGVLHFLRGGLNFALVELLNRAYGFRYHFSSFITSQRYRKSGGWNIKLDQYRKISIPADANLFVGDVIATGTTLENGLSILYERCLEEKKNIRRLSVFTIGCGRAEAILGKFHQEFKRSFDYEGTYLFYLEGRFGLPESKKEFRICLPGTDLVRHPALLAPEFEMSQYRKISYPLERCAVYDVGSRAFESQAHFAEVREYWKILADTGMTLYEAYKERWPETEYASLETLMAEKRKVWRDISDPFLKELHRAYEKRWTKGFLKRARSAGSLFKFCKRRLRELGSYI